MIINTVFDNIDACRAQIEQDFDLELSSNLTTRTVFLRGESKLHPSSESSMKRLITASDGVSMEAFYFASPFIDFEDVYAEYHSERHGLSHEEGVGFLQHYGFPTDLLDITPCFDTARFFACYEENGVVVGSIGVLGVFTADKMSNHFAITDLSNSSIAKRPKNQNAYVARPQHGLHDLKGEACEMCCSPKWYRFKKSEEDADFVEAKKEWIYPSKEEIAYFFERDLDQYFREHANYEMMRDDHRRRVFDKLEKIRNGLGNAASKTRTVS
jgi:hypothetical protein